MKHWNPFSSDKQSGKSAGSRIAFQGGAYSLAAAAILLAILIAANVLVSALPASMTRYDISATKLYSVTSNTKVVVNVLEEDVTIYWIVQSGAEDDVIETLLSKYDNLSDHITVVKKNPDVYPTFAEQYTDETVQNNSLVVECGDRSRYIGYDDIYVQEADMYSYSYSTSFDGEGAITSAIDYVVTDELVMIYEPSSDVSEEEKDMLADYTKNGGKLLVIAGPVQDGELTNLNSLLADYGVETCEGIVVEGNREYYTVQPHIILPDMNSSSITDPLIEEHYYPNMPLSQGLIVSESAGDSVTELLTTSDEAFSKVAGYELTTYEKEDGDIDGPFALAVSIDCGSDGQIVWFSSAAFLDDMYNALSSGSNSDLAMNALSSLIGETEAMAIRSKSLNYNYLSISGSTASLLKVLMIGVFPIGYLCIGVYVILKRRKKQNEAG